MTEVVIKTILAVVSSIAGAYIIFLVNLNHKKLCALISFSAGALLGAAVVSILPEVFKEITIIEAFLSTLSGYLLFWVISHYYFHVCPACSASHFDEQTTKKFSEVAVLLFTALSFHSFFDGVAISSSGIQNHEIHSGSSIFTAVLVHKFPEGLALASLMFGGNYPKSKILLYVLLVELTTVLGGISGTFLISAGISFFWLSIIEAHIAGGFIFLAFHALLGELFKNHKALVILYALLGVLLIFITRLIFA